MLPDYFLEGRARHCFQTFERDACILVRSRVGVPAPIADHVGIGRDDELISERGDDRLPRDGAPSCVTMRDIASMDLFVAPTIGFDLLYVLVIVRLERRNLVWINITPHPTAEWIARPVTEAFLGLKPRAP
jgi:hypothetical protein